MAQGGEFAFVLFAARPPPASSTRAANANMTAVVILSMALTPLVVIAASLRLPAEGRDRWTASRRPPRACTAACC